jgi:hypothetical protein
MTPSVRLAPLARHRIDILRSNGRRCYRTFPHPAALTDTPDTDMARRSLLALAALLLIVRTGIAQELPSIEDKTSGMTSVEGYFNLYRDDQAGKVWLEIERWDEDFLYVVSLPAGLGSNDIGLDRNQLGGEHIVRFERHGPRVLLVAPNMDYRALTDNEAERASVADAFASGVVHGFKVEAATGDRVLVDATDFIVRDAHGVIDRLRGSGQGTFRLSGEMSVPYWPMTKSFPENTEMEAMLTFTSDRPGGQVRSVASLPGSFTVRERQSFVKLPPPGYEPRRADPRAGFGGISFADYSSPIGRDMRVRYIARHRLEKKDPTAAMSEPVEPIVYYLDRGTPEPIRSALLEGAGWWNQAFEAAGFIDAFRVEVLPDSADPMDVRYNVINWVHRSTRGWSYGSSVTDPRTGEIIKGHVLLGSLRVRQDYLLAEGMLAPYDGSYDENDDPMLQMALARIRQLSAHEVGHTLGLQHNFAASVDGRASVMDYPAPLARLGADGRIDLSAAYDTGIGEWDKVAIRYGYSDFPDGSSEADSLDAIIEGYIGDGLHFITDSDARAPGGANPLGHLWDNGADVVDALQREMAVREDALARFGAANIRDERPMATLEEVLVPLYLRHRYQIDAVVKLVGGVSYSYAMRGDAQSLPEAVPADEQSDALEALIEAIEPDALALPEHLRSSIPPRPPWFGQHRELFDGYTGLVFDPYAPAEVIARQVLGLLVHPERAARLVVQNDLDHSLPGLMDVLADISDTVWKAPVPRDGYEAELQRLVQTVWVDILIDAAKSDRQSPGAHSRIVQHLRDLHLWLEENSRDLRDAETIAHRLATFDRIDRFIFRPYQPEETRPEVRTPPGSPIGSGERPR